MISSTVWFNVFTTIDRTIYTLYPKRFPFLSKVKNLIWITAVALFAIFLQSLHQQFRNYVYMKVPVLGTNLTETAVRACILSGDARIAHTYITFFERLFSIIIMFGMNFIIIYVLHQSKKSLRSQKVAASSKEYIFALTLIRYKIKIILNRVMLYFLYFVHFSFQ